MENARDLRGWKSFEKHYKHKMEYLNWSQVVEGKLDTWVKFKFTLTIHQQMELVHLLHGVTSVNFESDGDVYLMLPPSVIRVDVVARRVFVRENSLRYVCLSNVEKIEWNSFPYITTLVLNKCRVKFIPTFPTLVCLTVNDLGPRNIHLDYAMTEVNLSYPRLKSFTAKEYVSSLKLENCILKRLKVKKWGKRMFLSNVDLSKVKLKGDGPCHLTLNYVKMEDLRFTKVLYLNMFNTEMKGFGIHPKLVTLSTNCIFDLTSHHTPNLKVFYSTVTKDNVEWCTNIMAHMPIRIFVVRMAEGDIYPILTGFRLEPNLTLGMMHLDVVKGSYAWNLAEWSNLSELGAAQHALLTLFKAGLSKDLLLLVNQMLMPRNESLDELRRLEM